MKLTVPAPVPAKAAVTAKAPNGNLSEGRSDPKAKALKPKKYVKRPPRRFKLRPVKVDISKRELEDNWKSLKVSSKLQGLFVLLMIGMQVSDIEFVKWNKVNNLVNSFWICDIFMAITACFTFLVTKKRFGSPGYIRKAMTFQNMALITWISSFLAAMMAIFSDDDKEVSFTEPERLLLSFTFVIFIMLALIAWLIKTMLSVVGGYEASEKVHSFNDRYGDIIFEVRDLKEKPPRPQSQNDDPKKYDLV